MLRILTFYFCIAASAALADQGSDESLKASLKAMGYENIVFEGCDVSYTQKFVPTHETNGFSSLTHILKVSQLAPRKDAQLRRLKAGEEYYNILTITFSPGHFELYRDVLYFRRWARENFPDANWPNLNPVDFDASYQELERELRRIVPDLENLSRKVMNTNFGKSTAVYLMFQMHSSEAGVLEVLVDDLYRYSAKNNCN